MSRAVYAAAAIAIALTACNKQPSHSNGSVTNGVSDADNAAAGNEAMSNTAAPAGNIDAAFVTEAMKADNGEVALGTLAQQKGSSSAVKDLGKMLATDHAAHKRQVAAVAQSANIPVTNDLKEETKDEQAKLQALSGAAFDKEFARATVEAHEKDIAKFEQQAKSGDRQTAAMASKTLPTLRKHLKAAEALER